MNESITSERNDDPAMEPTPLALSVAEVLKLLPIGRTRLYAALAEGRIRSFRIGDRILIPWSAMEELLGEGQDGRSDEGGAARMGGRGPPNV